MQYFKFSFGFLASVGLFFTSACNNSNQTATTEKSSVTSNSIPASGASKTNNQHGASKGGQVVETGDYHLEFVAEKEANQTHMDLYLQTGDNHATVADAKVTGQVQLPNGKQKTIAFTYDANDQHYTAILPDKISGEYQVKVSADVKGKKVDGRFNFNR